VFLNLPSNARQAMAGAPQRRLSLRTAVEQEREIAVEISDTGKGFSAEEAKKLFTPFYTTKQSGHGTGLGLSISRSIIKDHGGSIQASGAPGQGATFTVRLPVRSGAGLHGDAAGKETPRAGRPGQGCRRERNAPRGAPRNAPRGAG